MNKNKQAGMSLYALLIILLVAGFFMLLGFKLVPAYAENMYIRSALKSLAEEHSTELAQMNKGKIRTELSRFYMLNNVRSDGAKALEIDRQKERTLIIVAYEVRVPIIGNVDAVMSFNNVLDSSKPEECCSVDEE